MDMESVRKKYNRHPKRFGEATLGSDFYTPGPIEVNTEQTKELAINYSQFSELGGRIRHLAHGIDEHSGLSLEDSRTELREYRVSIAFDKYATTPFLTLTAYYVPNAEEHTQTLLPIGEVHYPEGTEAPIRLIAEWWPPVANSHEWGAPDRSPYVATGFNDFYKFVGKPITKESLDITQLHDVNRSSQLLTLLESSILEAEIQTGKNIVRKAKDSERFRLLDRVSPVMGVLTVTGRWAFSDEVRSGGPTENLDTPFQGTAIPIRGIIDQEVDEYVDLEPGKSYELKEMPLLTVADLTLSLALAGRYELAARFSSPLQTHNPESEFWDLTATERLYAIGIPASGSVLGRFEGRVDVFQEPIGSSHYYNPRLKALGLPLLRPGDKDIPYDPTGGMLPLPPDKKW